MLKNKFLFLLVSVIFFAVMGPSVAMRSDDEQSSDELLRLSKRKSSQNKSSPYSEILGEKDIAQETAWASNCAYDILYIIFSEHSNILDCRKLATVCKFWNAASRRFLEWFNDTYTQEFMEGNYYPDIIKKARPYFPKFTRCINLETFDWVIDPLRFSFLLGPIGEDILKKGTGEQVFFFSFLNNIVDANRSIFRVEECDEDVILHLPETLSSSEARLQVQRYLSARQLLDFLEEKQPDEVSVRKNYPNLLVAGYFPKLHEVWKISSKFITENPNEFDQGHLIRFIQAYTAHFTGNLKGGKIVEQVKLMIAKRFAQEDEHQNAISFLERYTNAPETWQALIEALYDSFFMLSMKEFAIDDKKTDDNVLKNLSHYIEAYCSKDFPDENEESWKIKSLKWDILEWHDRTNNWKKALTFLSKCCSKNQGEWEDFTLFLNQRLFEGTGDNKRLLSLSEIPNQLLQNIPMYLNKFYENFPKNSALSYFIINLHLIDFKSHLKPKRAAKFLSFLLEKTKGQCGYEWVLEDLCLHALEYPENRKLYNLAYRKFYEYCAEDAEFVRNELDVGFKFHNSESQKEKKEAFKKLFDSFPLLPSYLYMTLSMASQIGVDALPSQTIDNLRYIVRNTSEFHKHPKFKMYNGVLKKIFYNNFFTKKGKPKKVKKQNLKKLSSILYGENI